MIHIFLSAYIAVFGQIEVYDVVEWQASTIEEAMIALSECQELTEQSVTMLQCEMYVSEEGDNA